jgi:signal transduction histidine kinase
VARHAAARHTLVKLDIEADAVVLTVTDDGRGFRYLGLDSLRAAGHFGIVGLHERAARIAGSVTVQSKPGAGTTVTAHIPSVDRVPAEMV